MSRLTRLTRLTRPTKRTTAPALITSNRALADRFNYAARYDARQLAANPDGRTRSPAPVIIQNRTTYRPSVQSPRVRRVSHTSIQNPAARIQQLGS
ncbi:hypothetical protein M5D96_013326 [Drosophila gunungcola]|uniref:Uncharacterized protein n=1 Tax=Drosophila gunungcola TaxID=103775 RepID=A0A9P9YBG3_9MUSC|nr:hypothetical protein M5D96_013326 [Drosophila gunungcola]